MFEWSDIRVFLAVMRHGSAAAAARHMATNQTTVSRRIERLEAALGLRLFDPGPRGAEPTGAARRLLGEAEQMAAAAEAFDRRAGDLGRRLSGTIRLTANPTALRYAAGVIRDFERLHPGVHVEVDAAQRTLSLEEGEADIALRPGVRLAGDTLVARKLMDHPWGFYAAAPYLERHGRPSGFDELGGHRIVQIEGEAAGIAPIPLAHARLPADTRITRIGSLFGLIGLLRAGEGLGFLPRAEGDADPTLVFCFGAPDLVQGLWVVTSRAGHADPLIRAFMRFCAERVRRILEDLPADWRV